MNNLIGKRINSWTILEEVPRPSHLKSKGVYWKCQCKCGLVITTRKVNIVYGTSKSCRSCSHREGFQEISGWFWGRLIASAKKRNIEFNLSIEQIWDKFLEQNRKCALSGVELKFKSFSRKEQGNASLDRIDSSKGYTIDNVQWVDKDVNIMKLDHDEIDFKQIVKRIYHHSSLKYIREFPSYERYSDPVVDFSNLHPLFKD